MQPMQCAAEANQPSGDPVWGQLGHDAGSRTCAHAKDREP